MSNKRLRTFDGLERKEDMMAQAYLERGVSPTKDEVKAAVQTQDKGIYPGAFCKVIPDIAGDPQWCT
ncbi:MAG TPA: hypothetical protein GX717_09985, partial [Clostridiaceae bacterium]|nr:hypothetical protein [Clostridiaceae bacterium]